MTKSLDVKITLLAAMVSAAFLGARDCGGSASGSTRTAVRTGTCFPILRSVRSILETRTRRP